MAKPAKKAAASKTAGAAKAQAPKKARAADAAKAEGSGAKTASTEPKTKGAKRAAASTAPAGTKAAKAPAKATAKKTPVTQTKDTPAPSASRGRSKKDEHVEQAPVTSEETFEEVDEESDSNGVFDKTFLEQQKKLLLEERAKYIRQADRLAAEAQSLVEEYEPGDVQFDDESGEGDTIAVERERDLALSAAAREAVAEIDAALARIENGTYGLSVVSGQPIPKERLRAIPWASTRVEEKVGGLGAPRR